MVQEQQNTELATPSTYPSAGARYQALLEVSRSIASCWQIPALLEALNRSLRQFIAFDGVSLTLYVAGNPTQRLYQMRSGGPSECPLTIPDPFGAPEKCTMRVLRLRRNS
jgi:hypothetical protein